MAKQMEQRIFTRKLVQKTGPHSARQTRSPFPRTLPLGGDTRRNRSDDFDQPLQARDSREYQLTAALLVCVIYCVAESYEAKRLSLKPQRYLIQAGHRGTKIPYGGCEANQDRKVTTSKLKPRNALSSLEWNRFYAPRTYCITTTNAVLGSRLAQ